MACKYDDKSNDFSLLTECINGRRDAWNLFVERYSKLVYHSITRTFRFYTSSFRQEDVDDIFNSIFLSLIENNYKKLKKFDYRYGCTLTSWIRLISTRYTIDFLRSQKKHNFLNNDYDTATSTQAFNDPQMSVIDQLEWTEKEKNMQKAIEILPRSDRLFIKLYYEKELSPEQVADIMKVSVSTIYSKKNRIREKIKKILEDKGLFARKTN